MTIAEISRANFVFYFLNGSLVPRMMSDVCCLSPQRWFLWKLARPWPGYIFPNKRSLGHRKQEPHGHEILPFEKGHPPDRRLNHRESFLNHFSMHHGQLIFIFLLSSHHRKSVRLNSFQRENGVCAKKSGSLVLPGIASFACFHHCLFHNVLFFGVPPFSLEDISNSSYIMLQPLLSSYLLVVVQFELRYVFGPMSNIMQVLHGNSCQSDPGMRNEAILVLGKPTKTVGRRPLCCASVPWCLRMFSFATCRHWCHMLSPHFEKIDLRSLEGLEGLGFSIFQETKVETLPPASHQQAAVKSEALRTDTAMRICMSMSTACVPACFKETLLQ